MDHRQDYPERDELRAKFTRWLEKVIKRAKIDYLRKYENRPKIISYEDIPEAELLDLAQCESWLKITRMQSPYDFEEERLTYLLLRRDKSKKKSEYHTYGACMQFMRSSLSPRSPLKYV